MKTQNAAQSATPRTDAKCSDYAGPLSFVGDEQFLPADFARTLECELAAKDAEVVRLREYAFGMERALRAARASGTASEAAWWAAECAELRLRCAVLMDELRAASLQHFHSKSFNT